jgi:hypothetical protein
LRKNYAHFLTYAIFVFCIFSVPSAIAHSPLISAENRGFNDSMFISDPTKSWAIYGELHEGREVDYYRFEIEKGQKIFISLMKPVEDKGFMPGFVLMGPGFNNQGNIPGHVEQPEGTKAIVVSGVQPEEATYEPFTPGSFYQLAQLDIPAPESGNYYVAVFGSNRSGHYSLAIGEREDFSLTEWILIPVRLISIYQWEGQGLLLIFSPIAMIIAVGLVFIYRKNMMPVSLFEWAGILAGLLFLGSGFMFLFQMGIAISHTRLVQEVVITIIIALVSILLSVAVIRTIMKKRGKVDIMKRAYLAIIGILALFVWAGFLVGPFLAVLASIIPDGKQDLLEIENKIRSE